MEYKKITVEDIKKIEELFDNIRRLKEKEKFYYTVDIKINHVPQFIHFDYA